MTDDISRLEQYPVLGICGCSGVGKTTLIESLLPLLVNRGLQVIVVKHGARNVCIDVPGKDSHRFFEAGGDVSLFGEESFVRYHDQNDFISFLINLCRRYDLVLVEGHAKTPIPKIWLLDDGFTDPPENRGRLEHVLTREDAHPAVVLPLLERWLEEKNNVVPVWGCVLIGGKSQRMGQPKHLLRIAGKTWLEHAVNNLAPFVDQVVLSGKGEIPGSLHHLPRIPDAPGICGPMAGVLAVMRWQPAVSWLVMACDLPDVQPESLQWLLDKRRPGVHAIMPDLENNGRVEPLLAWYGYRCHNALEDFADSGIRKMSCLTSLPGVYHFHPPESLRISWHNVNTPDELP